MNTKLLFHAFLDGLRRGTCGALLVASVLINIMLIVGCTLVFAVVGGPSC